MSNIDFFQAIQCLSSAESIAITCHIRPDGDALGSAAGLLRILENQGKAARIILPSPLPSRYSFLFEKSPQIIKDDWQEAELGECDTVVVLDTAAKARLSPQFEFLCSANFQVLVIDHHLPSANNDELGTVRLIDPAASSVGLLIAELAQAWSVPVDKPTAEALFTALATDTGWFRFANTDSRTYRLAAWLSRLGASPSQLYETLYLHESAAKLRLTGRALASLELLCEGRLACTTLLQDDFCQSRAEPADTEDLINEAMRIGSVIVAVMLVQEPDCTRISLRSKGQIDVAGIAEQFAGGGHKLAAGARLPCGLDQAKEKLLASLGREFARLDKSQP